jgi:hypothetical protein
VRVDAALADEPQRVEAIEQRRLDARALTNQHQRFGVLETLGQDVDVLRVIVPDGDSRGRPVCESTAAVRSVSK